ncbi:Por secretion system C-terminal sorting domain-containing protein [Lishizhenia tianjinensis]|uniref:Por secretion system C-terminal sorting domain-containing protein n=1 Tax=Lishizhenia tianjinensis TaxID=477690 RepID=A0A1I6XAD3_9FLAO|nr:T9SS type A sorting domain-containing protein [Lishizhenia tianjinensis]SFT35295.1 Por secretion system C-terminal sorting domain-containing protein [Lishizhenia tianjinensis]
MKSLTFLLLLLTSISFAQQTWVSDNAKWTYTFHSFPYGGYIIVQEVMDTVIMGEACKGYETTQYNFGMNQFGETVELFSEVLDTNYVYYANDTVHMYYESDFHPIYIFNLNQNTTYNTMANPSETTCAITSNISVVDSTTVTLSGQDYLQYTLSADDNNSFRINGVVNSRFGHFETTSQQYSFVFPRMTFCFMPDESPFYSFSCFEDDDISYTANTGSDCIYPYNTIGIETFDIDLNLINPVINGEIQLPSDFVNVRSTITDLKGQVVLRSTNNTLKVSTLENGIYLLHVEKEGKVYTKKMVIRN